MSKYYEPPRRPAIFAYLQLLRLPNLFTAVADVAMGFLFVQAAWFRDVGIPLTNQLRPIDKWMLGLLAAASVMLYAAGVVLNDVFDVELDRQERPERPLPSGRVRLGTARTIGWGLLFGGAVVSWLVCVLAPRFWRPLEVQSILQFRPGVAGTLLAVTIVLYNAILKRTVTGPIGMGACRMLNVLLGMSLLPGQWELLHWLVAGAIGVYIAGVTWFARDEAGESSLLQLGGALGVMLSGVGLLALLPLWMDKHSLQVDPTVWYIVMALIGARIVLRCGAAGINVRPGNVQAAVGQSILTLVLLDAAVCFAARGPVPALCIVALIVPAGVLALWIKPT